MRQDPRYKDISEYYGWSRDRQDLDGDAFVRVIMTEEGSKLFTGRDDSAPPSGSPPPGTPPSGSPYGVPGTPGGQPPSAGAIAHLDQSRNLAPISETLEAEHLNPEQVEDIQALSGTYLEFAKNNMAAMEEELAAQLEQVGKGRDLGKDFGKKIVGQIFTKVQADILQLNPQDLQGLTPGEITALVPHIQKYSKSIRGLNKVVDTVVATDQVGYQAQIAKTRLKLDTSTLRQDLDDARSAIRRLYTEENLGHDDLEQINVTLGKIRPQIEKIDPTKPPQEIQEHLKQVGDDIELTVQMLLYFRGGR